MFDWIYEIPPWVAIAVFSISFVSVCWFGIFLSHAAVKARFQQQPGLNAILGELVYQIMLKN